MSALLLPVTALVPALLLLWYFWSRDLNPEPRGAVLKTFRLGAVNCLPVIPVASGLEALGSFAHGTWPHAPASAFLGAAIPSALAALPTAASLALFRSGLRGPFRG